LFENGRIDNIFTDSYYDVFTECLDEVAKKFTALYNDSRKYRTGETQAMSFVMLPDNANVTTENKYGCLWW
jgi:hypothetical protein